MSTLSSIGGSVTPTSYLSSQAYSALSTTQQKVADAAQTQIDSQTSILSSLYGGSTPSPAFSFSNSSIGGAASSGLSTQENSALELVSNGLSSSNSVSSNLILQSALQQSVSRNGLGTLLYAGTSAADAVSAGQAAQEASKQALLSSLYNLTGTPSPAAGSILSLYA